MLNRPAIGTRVRVRGNTGIVNMAGRTGVVSGHHKDGTAVQIELDTDRQALLCDPSNIDPVNRCRAKMDVPFVGVVRCEEPADHEGLHGYNNAAKGYVQFGTTTNGRSTIKMLKVDTYESEVKGNA
jgi:hypothetical protein